MCRLVKEQRVDRCGLTPKVEFENINDSLQPELPWLRTVCDHLEQNRIRIAGKLSGLQLEAIIKSLNNAIQKFSQTVKEVN